MHIKLQVYLSLCLLSSVLKTLLALLIGLLSEHVLERLLDQTDQLAQAAEEIAHSESITLDANCVDKEVHKHPVRADEDQEDTKVSPFLVRLDIQSLEILVTDLVRAVLTATACTRVQKVASSCLCELSGV